VRKNELCNEWALLRDPLDPKPILIISMTLLEFAQINTPWNWYFNPTFV